MSTQILLNNARSFADIVPIVEQAEARLSFWGTRYVYLPIRNETLPIDAIAAKVIQLIRQNPDSVEDQRAVGRRIASLVDRIYQTSDQQVAQSNCLTWLFVFLRNLPNLLDRSGVLTSSWTSYAWRDCEHYTLIGYRQRFDYYTREQYLRNFHHYPEEIPENDWFPTCDQERPPRWRAPQAVI